MKNKLQRVFDVHTCEMLVFLVIAFQPIIDLDYLIYPYLNQVGLPRPSTVIRFLLIPILIVWIWFKKDKNKKKTFVFSSIYLVILALYFVIHCKVADQLYDRLYLTTNFKFILSYEFTYCFTLVIPYFMIYMIYQINWKEDVLKKIILITSAVISIPIVLSDLFLFGKSTYVGYTPATFFSWFNDATYEIFAPRQMACKFFFEEGNTTGIVLIIILPLLYYFFFNEKNKRNKIIMGGLIVLHSLAMLMISTRIATYGAMLVPAVVLAAYIFLCLLKKERFCTQFVMFTVAVAIVAGLIIPHSPAYKNQILNQTNNLVVLEDDDLLQEGKKAMQGNNLIPGSIEFNQAAIYIFKDYGIKNNLISTLPEVYYLQYYHYEFDPLFWISILFDYPFSVRCSGREFERAFQQYKWDILTPQEKLTGMGYSTFMEGSILLEADFEQQVYSFGYIGAALMVLPWLIILIGSICVVLINWKKLFTFKVFMLVMCLGVGLVAGYMSGHTLDEFMSTIVLSVVAASLIREIQLIKKN